jgi:hypothetical protein
LHAEEIERSDAQAMVSIPSFASTRRNCSGLIGCTTSGRGLHHIGGVLAFTEQVRHDLHRATYMLKKRLVSGA